MSYEFALDIVDEIRGLWHVDPERLRWVGDVSPKAMRTEGYGFDWWPGDFKVSLRVHGPHPDDGEDDSPTFRLQLRCDLALDVDVAMPELTARLSELNATLPCCAVSAIPRELLAEAGEADSRQPVRQAFVGYVNPSNRDWFIQLFYALGLLLPIEAQQRAEQHAAMLGGKPDRSAPPGMAGPLEPDELLGVDESLFIPEGQQAKLALCEAEFPDIVERWGRGDWSFGQADGSSLVMDLSFGEDSALLRLDRELVHDRLGGGLASALLLPHPSELREVADLANYLNMMEAGSWVPGRPPLLGNWFAHPGSDGRHFLLHQTLMPTLVDRPGLAEAVVLWSMARLEWVRQTVWPEMVNRPIVEILRRRYELQQ